MKSWVKLNFHLADNVVFFFSLFIIQKYWIHFEISANEKTFFFLFFCSTFHMLIFANSLPYIFFPQKILFRGSAKGNCSPSLLLKHFQYSVECQDTRDDIHLIKPLYFQHLSSSLWASFLHVAEYGEPREAVGVPSSVFKARMDGPWAGWAGGSCPSPWPWLILTPALFLQNGPSTFGKELAWRKCPSMQCSWWRREGIVPSAPAQCPEGADVQQVLIPGDHRSSTESCWLIWSENLALGFSV